MYHDIGGAIKIVLTLKKWPEIFSSHYIFSYVRSFRMVVYILQQSDCSRRNFLTLDLHKDLHSSH